MGFASAYLEKSAIFPEFINEAPDRDTGIIIVIPSYDEPQIDRVLDSLLQCDVPPCQTEVVIVVNAPAGARQESLRNNELTLKNIEAWKSKNSDHFFRLYPFNAPSNDIKKWGVGFARKTGMDEAVRRFNTIDRPDGIILSLDADCTVKKNYLSAIYDEFFRIRGRQACSIWFEHPLSGEDYSREVYDYIVQYELHLRYYLQGLIFTGYPQVYHTVGSSAGVRAIAYVKAGGMNRKQAGEDFYFIQKLIPQGGYFSLNKTAVYPSPRPSFRVPFGTGATIAKYKDSRQSEMTTYDFMAFNDLRSFFSRTEIFFNSFQDHESYISLPLSIRSFLPEDELKAKLIEIKINTAGYPSFRKRFFEWFNMFRIVKYLNQVHNEIFTGKPVSLAAAELLNDRGIETEQGDCRLLLGQYRSLERDV
jgi:hypothetical protein